MQNTNKRTEAQPRSLLDESDLVMVLGFEPFEGDKGQPLDLRRLRNEIRTAAKAHPCHGCDGEVDPGERHRLLVEVSRVDGIMAFRWCQACMRQHGRWMLGVTP